MQRKISPQAAPSQSANDNGPLTSGQVKALKVAIAVMTFLIVASLLAIVGRVIYLASSNKTAAPAKPAALTRTLMPKAMLALPTGATVKSMSLQNDRLLVHYETTAGPGAAILDLVTGKQLSNVTIVSPASQ